MNLFKPLSGKIAIEKILQYKVRNIYPSSQAMEAVFSTVHGKIQSQINLEHPLHFHYSNQQSILQTIISLRRRAQANYSILLM